MRTTKKLTISLLLLALGLFAQIASAQQPIGKGTLYVFGMGITADPSQQTVTINMGTGVNTHLVLPNISVTPPILPQDLVVAAELTGPGITTPIIMKTKPGEMLMIPPLLQDGTYILDKIRLMIGDQILLYAEPSTAFINTLEKLLITQVTSRALSIDEIESLGITINPENFTAYKFTVGFATESGAVHIELPVIIDVTEGTNSTLSGGGGGTPALDLPQLQVPNLYVRGFTVEPDKDYYEDVIPSGVELPAIAGAVVIPGNIAFLNQFFEVMLLVTNNAPQGSKLVAADLTAEIFLPAGQDNIPLTYDDPLRIAQTETGAHPVVPVVNAADKGSSLSPQASGEGRFLVEGRREGTYQVNIDIKGILTGLPTGPIHVKGKAVGTVVVRNPSFSLTFGHPDVVVAGEGYSLFVTVNNTSQVDANLVSLNLLPSEIFGATMIADSDPETPLGTVTFRTIRAGDSAVAEYKLIARRAGQVTSAAFEGAEGVQGSFNLRTGVGERGIPLSPDSIVLSSYVKNLPHGLLQEAMRVLGLAHSVATAPSLPVGITRIPRSVIAQRAYELTEAGLRIQMGEPLHDSICGLILDWSGDILPSQGFDGILTGAQAGTAFTAEAAVVTGNSCPAPSTAGPKVISAVQLPEADPWNRGRVVAVLFDRKIQQESVNDASNYKLVYRTMTKELRNFPKGVKILPGKRIIEIFFEGTISPFFEYDLILSGIKGLSLQPQEPDPVRLTVVTTLKKPGGIVSGKVMRGDGSPIPYTEVSVQEKFEDPNDPFGATFSVNTMRTLTDAEGNYQLDFVAMEREPFTVQASDPETGQSGSARSRVIMDGQHLRLDILLLGLGTLTGTVVKAEDQSPVQGAVVRASSLSSGGSFSTVSGSDGRFVIRMVTVGTLGVSAEAGLYSGSVSAQIPSAGATADVTVPVYSKGMGTGSVAGRVYEADGKTPVAGVPVTITGSHGYGNWKYSDTGGNYLFEAVPPGTFALRTFRQETGEQASANSAVSAGATTTVNLVLPGTAIIIGTVYDSNGLPVEGAEVLSGVTLVTTDRNGNFRIEKVPIGQVAVTAAIPGARDVISVTVGVGTPGEVVRVVIALQADSSISAKGVIQGYVKDPHGQPVRYQTVYIWDGETTPDVVSTDADGFFRNEMPLGSYSVRIVNDDLTDGDMKGKSLSLNSQIVTLELQFKGLGRITGTVFQPDGVTPTVANVLVTKTYFTAIGTP